MESAFEDKAELTQIRQRLDSIVKAKRKTRSGMSREDIDYTESVQRQINDLFREGKIDRELLFIPANYYAEGVVANVPVDCAGVL